MKANLFDMPFEKVKKKIMGKGEKASIQHLLLFPQ